MDPSRLKKSVHLLQSQSAGSSSLSKITKLQNHCSLLHFFLTAAAAAVLYKCTQPSVEEVIINSGCNCMECVEYLPWDVIMRSPETPLLRSLSMPTTPRTYSSISSEPFKPHRRNEEQQEVLKNFHAKQFCRGCRFLAVRTMFVGRMLVCQDMVGAVSACCSDGEPLREIQKKIPLLLLCRHCM